MNETNLIKKLKPIEYLVFSAVRYHDKVLNEPLQGYKALAVASGMGVESVKRAAYNLDFEKILKIVRVKPHVHARHTFKIDPRLCDDVFCLQREPQKTQY